MDYRLLTEYGIVGNLESVALVGQNGAIDWCCLPHVESPSVFARILDSERGGHFSIQPTGNFESTQEYADHTNILRTQFQTATGRATVTDFMPVPEVATAHPAPNQAIFRHVTCQSGRINLGIEFQPRFDYARAMPTVEPTEHGVRAATEDETVFLSSGAPLHTDDDAAATAEVELSAGESHWVVLGYDHEIPIDPTDLEALREDVAQYWREWAHECQPEDNCPIAGEWHDLAVRSTFALKLLTHAETGAICAAPTTSLPEDVGGVRNWDYRYNWIRDAAFTVRALSELGHVDEANEYFNLCLTHCGNGPPSAISPVYGLHGDDVPAEQVLEHLTGYRNSSPVRIGNAAAEQHQLDVYGELVHGVYTTVTYGNEIDTDDWRVLRDVVDYVCEAWREPDVGIWEMRTDRRHFVYSKVMCWVALDRGIRFVEDCGFDGPVDRWRNERQLVREEILERGYSGSAESFVRSFGEEDTLDATGLLIPIVGFLPFNDERVQSTIDATQSRLVSEGGLVERYEGDDGLPGEEGAFVMCSFWLVTSLARSGRIEEATETFEAVVEHASPLGLLAEEIDPESGEQRGNYPQAFSHIGLINSVISLTEARRDDESEWDVRGNDAIDEDAGEKNPASAEHQATPRIDDER